MLVATSLIKHGTREFKGLRRPIIAVILKQPILEHINSLAGNRGSTTWGMPGDGGRGGIVNSKNDPHRAERLGLLGEFATSALFDVPVDEESRKHGDKGWDFMLNNGEKIDSKLREKWYGNLLFNVTAYGTDHREHTLHADYYIACYLRHYEQKFAVIDVYGYQTKDFIEALPLQNAYNGSHKNKEVSWNQLLDINELLQIHHEDVPF